MTQDTQRSAAVSLAVLRAAPRAERIATWALAGVAITIGIWLAATAVYRADDYLVIADAWAGGSPAEGLRRWWDAHFATGVGETWPRFYRPTWRLLFLVDAHVFGCRPALSALLSWWLHCATAVVAGHICRRVVSPAWALLATWVVLLPGAAVEGALWISARGTLLAALFTLLAIAAALAARLSGRHLALVVAPVLLAATSNEVGLAAAPLVCLAMLLAPRGGPAKRRLAAMLVLLLAVGGLLLWRRAMLGDWVGGYAPDQGLRAWHEHLGAILSGAGAVVLPGHGPVPATCTHAVGAAALLGIAAAAVSGRRAPRHGGTCGGADLALLGLAMIVAFLVWFPGAAFRGADDTNGRALYPVHAGWALALGGSGQVLAARAAKVARTVAFGIAAGVGAAFVAVILDYAAALRTANSLFPWLARAPLPAPSVLLDMPDRAGPFLLARNAVGIALQPPFRQPAAAGVAHATDHDLAHGTLAGLAAALPHLPAVAAWHWDAAAQTFVEGWWSTTVDWRGAVTADGDGLRCGGVRLVAGATGLPPALVPGAFVGIHGELRGDPHRPELRVGAVRSSEPELQHAGGRSWRFRGRTGDWFFLLVGSEPCCLGLGAAGTLGIARPQVVPVRVLDSAEPFPFELPPAVGEARLLQPFVTHGDRVRLGELHERR